MDYMNQDPSDPKSEIALLTHALKYHANQYYNTDSSDITDAEYDAKMRRLSEIEQRYPEYAHVDSPTRRVGSYPTSDGKIAHKVPMLSLDNVFDEVQLKSFYDRVKDGLGYSDTIPLTFCVECKIDGLSCSLWYENGSLLHASTRGDGQVGENVTTQALIMECIPHQLPLKNPPRVLEVRGEVYISKDEFTRINLDQAASGNKLFANPRNLAAGTFRTLDQALAQKRKLGFIAHGVGYVEGFTTLSYYTTMVSLHLLGFKISNPIAKVSSFDDIVTAVNSIEEQRDIMPYEIDGAVIKLDLVGDQIKLGNTSKFPRHAVAFKFAAQEAVTTIQDIELGIGRTGKVTPVAKLAPVTIGGVTVSNATLHNRHVIASLGLRVGDTVVVRRSGDVIPQITHNRTPQEDRPAFVFPRECPSCGGLLIEEDSDVRCVKGFSCPEQMVHRFTHLVSRDALNVMGLSEKTIRLLIANHLIREPADIFKLKEHESSLVLLPGMGSTSVTSLLENIEKSRRCEGYKLLYGFGIRHIGKEVSRKIMSLANGVKGFKTLVNTLIEVNPLTLEKAAITTHGIGEVITQSLIGAFEDHDTARMWDDLVDQIEEVIVLNKRMSPLYGQYFVITGSFPGIPRSVVKDLIIENGGEVQNDVTHLTTYVLVGESPGSKLSKARKKNIPLITLSDLNEKIKSLV